MLGALVRRRSTNDKPAWRNPVHAETCVERARKRFESQTAALQYPSAYRRGFKGYFERRALALLLDRLPTGSHVLDMPCGTGREMHLLLARGFRVTGGDCSPHMVARCRELMLTKYPDCAHQIELMAMDVMSLDVPDRSFDAVVCNRLLHHFDASAARIAAIRELARVSRGPVVASFNQSGTLSGLRQRIRNHITLRAQRHLPTRETVAREFAEAGLQRVEILQVMPGLSRMCYIVGIPAP